MKRFGACLLLLLASAVVVAVSAAPAYAVDGVVLINQNTATSGLPGCGVPLHALILICQPGSYKLSGSLVVPSRTNGIEVTANNVTLDLNGFTISSTGGGNGIQSSTTATSVRNGVITGFSIGIVIEGSGIAEDLSIWGNNQGTILQNVTFRRNNVSSNTGTGVVASGSVVTENVANSNGGAGFFLTTSLFGNNTAVGNGGGAFFNNFGTVSNNANNCGGSSC